jgi:coenzyme F420-reducing hydrogenase beta subunit
VKATDMITKQVIQDYLETFPVQETSKTLKRTRASTRKFVEENKVEFKRIESITSGKIAFYELNGREHEIKVREDEEIERIIEISCSECKGESNFSGDFIRKLLRSIEEFFTDLPCSELLSSF